MRERAHLGTVGARKVMVTGNVRKSWERRKGHRKAEACHQNKCDAVPGGGCFLLFPQPRAGTM